jgi:hypothetical protein
MKIIGSQLISALKFIQVSVALLKAIAELFEE